MRLSTGRLGGSAAAALICLAVPATAGAATVVNGDFETGTIAGWTKSDDSSTPADGWRADSSATAPPGFPAPPQGNFAAVSQQTFPGAHFLYQDVALEPGFSHTLSLFVYYSTGGVITSPDSLDPAVSPNEQYRVDVMRPTAPIGSVAPGDVLLNVFRTATGAPSSIPPTSVTANLTPFAGQTVRLRFAEVDNTAPLNTATDAVQVVSADVTAPVVTITGGPADVVKTKKNKATTTFTFSGTDPRAVTGFQCSLDDEDFASCTSPHTVTVKKGTHRFRVRAVDQAGNVGERVTYDWKVKKKKKKKKK